MRWVGGGAKLPTPIRRFPRVRGPFGSTNFDFANNISTGWVLVRGPSIYGATGSAVVSVALPATRSCHLFVMVGSGSTTAELGLFSVVGSVSQLLRVPRVTLALGPRPFFFVDSDFQDRFST